MRVRLLRRSYTPSCCGWQGPQSSGQLPHDSPCGRYASSQMLFPHVVVTVPLYAGDGVAEAGEGEAVSHCVGESRTLVGATAVTSESQHMPYPGTQLALAQCAADWPQWPSMLQHRPANDRRSSNDQEQSGG